MDTRFASTQTVEMAVAQQPIPIQHYLRQPQRIVQALAASSQIEQLGAERFRLKMRPLSFMMLTIQPTVEMRVWSEPDGTVQVRSLNCEIRGVEYINQRFALNLVGKLQPQTIEGTTYLKGRADLEVQVEMPPRLHVHAETSAGSSWNRTVEKRVANGEAAVDAPLAFRLLRLGQFFASRSGGLAWNAFQ